MNNIYLLPDWFLRKQCVNKLFEFTYFRYLSVFEILCYLMATCNSYFTP